MVDEQILQWNLLYQKTWNSEEPEYRNEQEHCYTNQKRAKMCLQYINKPIPTRFSIRVQFVILKLVPI